QVTIPKTIARDFGIEPGSEIEWVPSGEVLRVIPPSRRGRTTGRKPAERLRLYDAATQRQRDRERVMKKHASSEGRGWVREDLYGRGSPR
ncbi:MAG: AbrB/MazE/SpoVT family DNA-binding domain-containing protein, partial [Candidatus Binatia bacterium]